MRFIPLASVFLLAAATAHAGPNVKALGKQFRKLDANRDESLSMSEFAKLLPSKLTRNNALGETQAMMFYWFDEDASEGIDLGEWIEAKTVNGSDSSPYFSYEVQDELNANGDGKLTWKEFSRVIPKYVASKTARVWFNAIPSGSYSGSSTSLGNSSYGSSYTLSGGTLTVGGSIFYAGGSQSGTTVSSVSNVSGSIATAPDSNSSLTLAPSDGSTTLTFPSGVTLDDSSSGDTSKTGTGTLTLDFANTFTGSTTISNGTLNLESSSGTLVLTDDELTLSASFIFFVTMTDAVVSSFQTVDNGSFSGTYTLFDLDTAVGSIDQGGTAGSE